MAVLLWILSFLGAIAAGFVAVFTILYANGAPQEASGFAMGLAAAVIPYVGARSWSEFAAALRAANREDAKRQRPEVRS